MSPDMGRADAPHGAGPSSNCIPDPLDTRHDTARIPIAALIAHWPSADELEPGDDAREIAKNRWTAARIAAWEDDPLDPNDDLALIANYPAEVERLRAAQERIRNHPVYRVAERAGDAHRRRFLSAALPTRDDIDEAAADEFFDDQLCECELRGRREFSDGRPVLARHVAADRCRWCLLRRVLEQQRFESQAPELVGAGASYKLAARLAGWTPLGAAAPDARPEPGTPEAIEQWLGPLIPEQRR